ncbi:MAG: MATE family efflux transporter [Candidatus Gastranaerophilales bacterium]|nr:MATE family efflux transporter [Candidatus Gastranaerophilales bacterium]
MNKIKEYKEIILNLIKLSLPILGGNISQILVSLADNIVAGRYSTLALGAISVASAIVMTVTIGAIGLILSVSPVISNLRGKNEPAKKYFKLTILFSILVSIPFFLILLGLNKYINFIGLSPDMVPYVKEYISICSWTVFPVAIFVAIKEFLQAYEKVVFANILMLIMVLLNLVLNIILTFGFNFGGFVIPGMGVVGLSIATLTSKTLVAIVMLLYCLNLFKGAFTFSKNYIKDLIKTGIPISAAIFFEFLGFNLTAVLIGKFSVLFAAVHNIILSIANCTFMIVLSIANAASVKIGFYNGRKDKENIIKYSNANIFLVICVCIVSFLILGNFDEEIAKIFSTDEEVIVLTQKIIIFAMAFLFFDGIQGACVGILKGLKDTKIIAFTMLSAYVFIAIPFGIYMAYVKNIVLEGFWIGLALALLFAAIVTSSRVIYNIKKM